MDNIIILLRERNQVQGTSMSKVDDNAVVLFFQNMF